MNSALICFKTPLFLQQASPHRGFEYTSPEQTAAPQLWSHNLTEVTDLGWDGLQRRQEV